MIIIEMDYRSGIAVAVGRSHIAHRNRVHKNCASIVQVFKPTKPRHLSCSHRLPLSMPRVAGAMRAEVVEAAAAKPQGSPASRNRLAGPYYQPALTDPLFDLSVRR